MRVRLLQVFFSSGNTAVQLALNSNTADDIIRKFRSREWKVRDEPVLMGTTEDGADYVLDLTQVVAMVSKPAVLTQEQQSPGQVQPQFPHGPWPRGSGVG